MGTQQTLEQYLTNLAKFRDAGLVDEKSYGRQAAKARELAASGKPMPSAIETKRQRRGFWKAFDRSSENW